MFALGAFDVIGLISAFVLEFRELRDDRRAAQTVVARPHPERQATTRQARHRR